MNCNKSSKLRRISIVLCVEQVTEPFLPLFGGTFGLTQAWRAACLTQSFYIQMK